MSGFQFGRGVYHDTPATMSTNRNVQAKNRAPASIQITAEQILREAKDRQLDVEVKAPRQQITDEEELRVFRMRKRKEVWRLGKRVLRSGCAVEVGGRSRMAALGIAIAGGINISTAGCLPRVFQADRPGLCHQRRPAKVELRNMMDFVVWADRSWVCDTESIG